jgi:hypothetical protein
MPGRNYGGAGITEVLRLTWSSTSRGKPRFGIGQYDEPLPDVITDIEALRTGGKFRFANQMRAWAEFDDSGKPVAHGVDGGCLMGITKVYVGRFGASFTNVVLPEIRADREIGDGWIRLTQTAGGRTSFPLPRRINRAPFVRLQSPLVWTTLSITLYANGRTETKLVGASPFPRHWVYDADGRLDSKAGTTDFATWMSQDLDTPWGSADSPVVVTAAETALERQLSAQIMRGGRRPRTRRLGPGEILMLQGEPDDRLYLLLDGVVAIDVDGKQVAELGPGAVIGERAILEGGRRTSTVTAVTAIRVAEADASSIDRLALEDLASGHRSEPVT